MSEVKRQRPAKMVFALLAAVAGIVAGRLFQGTGLSQSLPAVSVLQPAGSFLVPGDPGFRVEQSLGTENALYLFGRSAKREAQILKLDFAGNLDAAIPVPGDAVNIAVDDTGRIFALGRARKVQRLLALDATGGIQQEIAVQRPIDRVAVVGGRLIAWTDGLILLYANGTEPTVIPSPVVSPSFAVPLPNNELALIAAENPKLWILNSAGNVVQQAGLLAPEIKPQPRPQPETIHRTIFDAASNRSGDVLCAVSPYSLAEGGIILKFDRSGALQRRFRLALPAHNYKGTTEYMPLSHIAAAGSDLLFITSTAGRQCVYYRLPKS